ncbi:MAG: trehalose-6-phosphate synthase, partial [Pseudomonadota bacterium]
GYDLWRLPLAPEQVQSFYHITSKEALWPILHGFRDRYNGAAADWATFRAVNRAFAEAAVAAAAPEGVIWVHDYNLWLVPRYVRELRPGAKIAFFHHTPFPAAEIFNVLPWRREILRSLLDCDTLGFHIPRYAANFLAAAQAAFDVRVVGERATPAELSPRGQALSEPSTVTAIEHDGRRLPITAWPVGVDVAQIEAIAGSEATQAEAATIRRAFGGRRLIIGVGRTDYTKGGVALLGAYARLLARRPSLRGKVALMLVSVSAHRNMAGYRAVQAAIEGQVAEINEAYGSPDWQPVSLISNALPLSTLIAHYRAADIAWITPLADGLNLVAAEFVAARSDGDGVLVLSEFAGTAVTMGEAVVTNPFSEVSMDQAIEAALDMGAPERRTRMAALRHRGRGFDIEAWVAVQEQVFAELSARQKGRDAA